MSRTKSNLSNEILELLLDLAYLIPRPFEAPYQYASRIRRLPYREYYDAVRHLKRRGFIDVSKAQNQKFIQLTKAGELQALFLKARLAESGPWDGKWRLIIFDIPERSRSARDRLRALLRTNNFYKLQASVFVSPYPLNREAVSYLKKSGLIEYIRILRVDEMDDNQDLLKRFKLK